MPAHHGRGIWGRRPGALCCDVLDAWFEPSPKAKEAAAKATALLGRSPDAEYQELRSTISDVRRVNKDAVTLGAGSSEIIYRVLPRVVGSGKVVILDPTYSEYEHLLKNLGCKIHRVALSAENNWEIPFDSLVQASVDADAVVLVNPNNPTGKVLTPGNLTKLKEAMPVGAVLWVDEAYIDYCEQPHTFEHAACELQNIYVLKSMSKAYALSGMRAAYLICHPQLASHLRDYTPPWVIGTSAQLAAVAALQDEHYYKLRWKETGQLANELAASLRSVGLTVSTGSISAVLVKSPNAKATEWSEAMASNELFVRTTVGMGEALGDDYVRISVVERQDIERLSGIVQATLRSLTTSEPSARQ